ncbi:MAG: SPL family radical SAM protein [Acidobacteriaceae bacterium]
MANNHPSPNSNLFPILQPKPLTGMVRMAAEAEHVQDGHQVEFRALAVKGLMSKVNSRRRMWMAYGINPYRGCEFGCRYCYARYTHEFMERTPESFEQQIFVKQNAAWLLEQELRQLNPREEIAIGTATDPYQPIERTAQVTRSLLEVFARKSGFHLSIITKSNLIERDLDLLTAISRSNKLVVHLTVTTMDADLARILEPRAPRPDLRLQALKKLREADILAGVLCSPLLPGLNDTLPSIDAVASAAADACFFVGQPLFLKSCSRPVFFRFIREHFPALEAEYTSRYAEHDFATKAYRERMTTLVNAIRRKYRLDTRSFTLRTAATEKRKQPETAKAPEQQRLFA